MGLRGLRINGDSVREFCRLVEVSQRDLAEKAEVSESFLSNVLAGRKTISSKSARAIASALKVRLAAILRDPNEVDDR